MFFMNTIKWLYDFHVNLLPIAGILLILMYNFIFTETMEGYM